MIAENIFWSVYFSCRSSNLSSERRIRSTANLFVCFRHSQGFCFFKTDISDSEFIIHNVSVLLPLFLCEYQYISSCSLMFTGTRLEGYDCCEYHDFIVLLQLYYYIHYFLPFITEKNCPSKKLTRFFSVYYFIKWLF